MHEYQTSTVKPNSLQRIYAIPTNQQHILQKVFARVRSTGSRFRKSTEPYTAKSLLRRQISVCRSRRFASQLLQMVRTIWLDGAIRGYHGYSGAFYAESNGFLGPTCTRRWSDERERPISTCAEENVGCYAYGIDRYWGQSIIVHEFSHGLHIFGWRTGRRPAKLQTLLVNAYNKAKSLPAGKNGLGGYAATSDTEYFATGMQAYMNDFVNSGGDVTIHTREQLRKHDPDLYALIKAVLPCNNRFLNRCQNITLHKKAEVYSYVTTQEFEDMMANQKLKMNCKPRKRPPVSCLGAKKNVPLNDPLDECSYYVCNELGYVTGRYK
ncbi:uncharacterized protein LOC141902009 [Tubulanus polymorphus]|uniref:uncharacterized protein LOC141902009 n=1 Tax=Tubulanus polymorphus TaxID=672921 RepID=UPI003DA59AF0